MQILIVDDNEVNIAVYVQIFKANPELSSICFTSSSEALSWLEGNDPDLVLVDYNMPAPDGLEFIRHFRAMKGKSQIPVVMITGVLDKAVRYKALEYGANDFLTKPPDPIEFMTRAQNLLALRDSQKKLADHAGWLLSEVKSATTEISNRELETIYILTKTAEFRDSETGNHIIRMAHFSQLLGKALDLSEADQELLLLAAPMHDLGKVSTPDHILLKQGKLTPDEWIIMKQHAVAGYELLKSSKAPLLKKGAEIALGHHEKFDGSGYPYGRAGEDIPLSARIAAVGDVFDALVSRRPYKAAWPVSEAKLTIDQGSGTHFDPRVVWAFNSVFDDILLIKQRFSDAKAA